MPENDQINTHCDIPQLSETENIVCAIWSEVLQKDKINSEDNFFELGGDSLMTMMVMFKVNDDLHLELPPGAIMEAPTLQEFCKMIDSHLGTMKSGELLDEELDSEEVESGVI